MRITSIGVAALVVTAAVLLSGCTPAATGEPTTSSSPRPTATSTPAAVRTPAPACSALATSGEVVDLVGGTGSPAEFTHLQSGGIPRTASWSVLASNGTVCGWGERALGELSESGPPRASVFLQVVPGLEDAWNALATETDPSAGSGYDGAVSRGGRCSAWSCSTEVLVNGAWLHVEAERVDDLDESAFHSFVQGVVTRYRSLPAPTAIPGHPRACDDAALRAAVEGVFGEKGDLAAETPAFTLYSGLNRSGRAVTCRYDSSTDPHNWETMVTVLDDVDPALVASYRTGVDHPEATPVDVTVLGAGASGLFEPSVDSQRTIIDVLEGGQWLDVVTYGSAEPAKTVSLTESILASGWVGR